MKFDIFVVLMALNIVQVRIRGKENKVCGIRDSECDCTPHGIPAWKDNPCRFVCKLNNQSLTCQEIQDEVSKCRRRSIDCECGRHGRPFWQVHPCRFYCKSGHRLLPCSEVAKMQYLYREKRKLLRLCKRRLTACNCDYFGFPFWEVDPCRMSCKLGDKLITCDEVRRKKREQATKKLEMCRRHSPSCECGVWGHPSWSAEPCKFSCDLTEFIRFTCADIRKFEAMKNTSAHEMLP